MRLVCVSLFSFLVACSSAGPGETEPTPVPDAAPTVDASPDAPLTMDAGMDAPVEAAPGPTFCPGFTPYHVSAGICFKVSGATTFQVADGVPLDCAEPTVTRACLLVGAGTAVYVQGGTTAYGITDAANRCSQTCP